VGYEGTGLSLPAAAFGYASVTNQSLNITGPITLAARVRPLAESRLRYVIASGTSTTDGYELGIESNGRPFARFNRSSCTTCRVDAPSAISPVWTHLAATFDGSVAKLYVNGSLVAQRSMAVAATNAPRVALGALCTSPSTCSPASGTLFRGLIDDARIFARALPAERIKILSRIDPVFYFTWEDGSTTLARDSSGTCSSGLITGAGASIGRIGTGSHALRFTAGTPGYVQISNQTDTSPSSSFTISAWIQPDHYGQQIVVAKGAAGVDGVELGLTAFRKPYVQITRAGAPAFRIEGPSDHPLASWFQLAATYNGQSLILLVNGGAVASAPSPQPGMSVANNLPLTLGAGVGGQDRFTGILDDVRVYRHGNGIVGGI